MPSLPAPMGRLYRTVLRARMPVLWGAVAIAACTAFWYFEDPLLKRWPG